MKIIGISGLPGAGKGTAVEAFKKIGLPIINMGNIVRDEAKSLGFKITPNNLGKISLSLREKYGDEEVAKRCSKDIIEVTKSGSDVIIEGIRSLQEVIYFKTKFEGNFFLIAIKAESYIRFKRLKNRNREDDPRNREEFDDREKREIDYGLQSIIDLADYKIINQAGVPDLEKKIIEIYRRLP
jgi:dephospho-CoA kinase|tara:strand:- start:497 stop:1045 length:549 start_codon:yes stop_codon:yes gene_type:complete